MSDERLVHFIYLGGEFEWQHWRAVETATVHEAPIIIWAAAPIHALVDGPNVEQRFLGLPDWLRDHPIGLANVKDFYAWNILRDHGGLYLDLDTISLQPVWDLLTRDVLVSSEHEPGFDAGHPYNSAVVAGHKGALALEWLAGRAQAILAAGESGWGETGPHLLTEVVGERPQDFDVAPFGVLNGWRDDTIERYYAGERPGPDVRVVHLFSSSRPELFRADRWWPE